MKKFISKEERNSIEKLVELYGGSKKISEEIRNSGKLDNRLEKLKETEWLAKVKEATGLIKNINLDSYDLKQSKNQFGKATLQVSGFQGADAILSFLQTYQKNYGKKDCYLPSEMISVVSLTDEYVYGGDLTATLAITENLLGIKRFCTSSFVGTPQVNERINKINKATKSKFSTNSNETHFVAGLVNQGTPFGNLCGIECSNENYLLYLDGILRSAIETGATFFLNPSWSTIITGLYLGTLIPEIKFKVSCFLGAHSTFDFRLLINIIKEFLLEDGTSPITEINIGNGASARTFKECSEILKENDLSIDIAAHIRINKDLGHEDFNWFSEAKSVINEGYNLTLKYESAGTDSSLDEVAAYFVSDEERKTNAPELGNILFKRCELATQDFLYLKKKGVNIEISGGLQ